MNEASFWSTRLRPRIMQAAPTATAHRVENGLEAGFPDAMYCIDGATGFVECKWNDTFPVRLATPVFSRDGSLRTAQIVWWTQFGRAGGHGFIAAGVGAHTYLFWPTHELLLKWNVMTKAEVVAEACAIDDQVNYWVLTRRNPNVRASFGV